MNEKQADTTHFGFRDIPRQDKAGMVRGVFDSVASRYDLMNDFMSAGVHRLWKMDMLNALRPRAGMRLLDVAGGTGDIGCAVLKRAPGADVTLCDINYAMLNEGRRRSIDRNMLSGIRWVCGNAEALPVPTAAFDAYTIAFGIRNVTDIPAALAEAHRALKPGGHFLCLEFSTVQHPLLAQVYEWYSFNIIPRVGKMVAGSAEPYQYLVESIRRFPAPERFAQMLREAGFGKVDWKPMSGGIVALHSAWKI